MIFFSCVVRFFSRFTDPFEKECYDFFCGISPDSDPYFSAKRAQELLQKDTVRAMMILEWKFKGYTHLTKKYRKKCYENLEFIKTDFLAFSKKFPQQTPSEFLKIITQYLSPENRLEYRAGSSFDKLLQYHGKNKFIGDCNQITAFYVYLFSLKHDISHLQLKLLPEHVCLHYDTNDYETTTGQINKYASFQRISPIQELIAINILDISDQAEKNHPLPEENHLQRAELAFVFFGDRALAIKNLNQSYYNLAIKKMRQKNFNMAQKWAKKSTNRDLMVLVSYNEAVNFLEQKRYESARKIFYQLNNSAGLQAVDKAELQEYLYKLKNCKTISDYRSKKNILLEAKKLATTCHQYETKKFCEEVLQQI